MKLWILSLVLLVGCSAGLQTGNLAYEGDLTNEKALEITYGIITSYLGPHEKVRAVVFGQGSSAEVRPQAYLLEEARKQSDLFFARNNQYPNQGYVLWRAENSPSEVHWNFMVKLEKKGDYVFYEIIYSK